MKKQQYGPGMPTADDEVKRAMDEVQMRLSQLTLFEEDEEDEAMEE